MGKDKVIEKDRGFSNKLKKLLEKLKASLTDPHPELHEDHAKTRYRIASMTREEREAYERAMFDKACEDKAEFTVRGFTSEERKTYNEGLSKLFQKIGRRL